VNVVDVNVTTRSKAIEKHVFKRTKESKECCWLGERKMVEKVNGGDNSTNSKNTNLDKRAIHIHGGMEHHLTKYAK